MVQGLTPFIASHVTRGKFLNLAEPQFPPSESGNNSTLQLGMVKIR